MANQSTFPTTLDSTPEDKAIGDAVPVSAWNTYMDGVVNLETKVGIDSSAVATTVDYQIKTLPPAGIKSRIVQIVNYQTGTMATGTTTMPWDNTIPQITEGDQYMSLAFTPTNASNKLLIEVTIACITTSIVGAYIIGVALFQDAIENALASIVHGLGTGVSTAIPVSFKHYMTAGTTSAITFQVRAGGSGAGTTTFNGSSSLSFHGGVFASSITITEIAV